MTVNARRISADILFNIYKNNAYLNEEQKAVRNKYDLSEIDFRFINELTTGVIQNKIRIDYIISKNISIKFKKISLYILAILECAIYQVIFMDKVPASAAINEAVNLTKTKNLRKSSGFVNAVLRNVITKLDSIEYPQQLNEYLSIYYSFPLWIVDSWIKEFGEERTRSMIVAFSKKPELYFRANILKNDLQKLQTRLFEDNCVLDKYENSKCSAVDYLGVCRNVSDIKSMKSYTEGLFYIQDFAAALTVEVLDVKPGMTVIDMCAAPGGKSTHIAEKMLNRGKIYAFDLYEHKINKIKENAVRLGIDIIEASVNDSTVKLDELVGIADRVLVDAPCSGLGIIRRKPDIKYSRKPYDSLELSKVSYKILENAKNYLKVGGCLVFSTCTIEKTENDDVIDMFLLNNKNFVKDKITVYDIENSGSITLYPDIDNCDGFYICKLIKITD